MKLIAMNCQTFSADPGQTQFYFSNENPKFPRNKIRALIKSRNYRHCDGIEVRLEILVW